MPQPDSLPSSLRLDLSLFAWKGLGPRAALLAALLYPGALSCAGPEPGSETNPERLTPTELADLLAQGTIRPLTEATGSGASDLDPDMSEDPFSTYPAEDAMEGDPFAEFPAEMGASAEDLERAGERAELDDGAVADPGSQPEAAADGAEARDAEPGPGEVADTLAALEALAGVAPSESTRSAAPGAPDAPFAQFEENPYLAFGRRIKVYPDGTITKPYPLRPGTGIKMQQLIKDYGNLPIWTTEMGPGPSPPTMVKVDLLPEWDVELVQDKRNPADKRGESVPVADWLVVTTGEDLLWEVEEFINLFAAGVPQIEIEAKIVEITFSESLDYGIRPPEGVPILQWPPGTFVQGFDFSLPNQSDGIEGLLSIGGVQDGLTFNAILEAVAGNDNVSIISRPKVAVREGGRAQILSTQRVPFLEVTTVNNSGGFNTQLRYLETGVQLYVVPRVVGTDTVALDIDIEASQQTGNQTVVITSGSDEISVPILATRAARTVVYLRPGQAVILGGLINERSVDRVRKVPLLGDIPVLRHLFRSKFTSKEQSNVLFFIRPRILQGADLSRDF